MTPADLFPVVLFAGLAASVLALVVKNPAGFLERAQLGGRHLALPAGPRPVAILDGGLPRVAANEQRLAA
jgi:hypothetical protein